MGMKIRKEKNVKQDNALKKRPSKLKFYSLQLLKAVVTLLVASIPLNMKEEYVRILNRSTNVQESDILPLTSTLDYLTMLSALAVVIGVFFVLTRINWSYHKHEVNMLRKEQEKEELKKYYENTSKK